MDHGLTIGPLDPPLHTDVVLTRIAISQHILTQSIKKEWNG